MKAYEVKIKYSACPGISVEHESSVTLDRLPEWAKISETTFPDSILEIYVYESGKVVFEYKKERILKDGLTR